jgi:hypothetical protein
MPKSSHTAVRAQGKEIMYRCVLLLLAILAGAVMLIGCGGSASSSKRGSPSELPDRTPVKASYVPPVPRQWPTQATGPAISACRNAVAKATSLSNGARREISEPCDSMDERVKENEAIVRAVCRELAHAVSSPSNAPAAVTYSHCYAEYAKTLAGALNLRQ